MLPLYTINRDMIRNIITYFIVAVFMTGCAQIEHSEDGGELRLLGVVVDSSVEGKQNSGEVVSRTSAEDHIFEVTITDSLSGEVVEHYDNHLDVPSTIVLSAGTYLIEVYSADINSQLPLGGVVGFEQPQYGASEYFTIVSGSVTPLTLTARMTTVGVTVQYSDLFKRIYPCNEEGEDYHVVVYSSHGDYITFNSSEARTAYFKHNGAAMELLYQVYIKRVGSSGSIEELTTAEPTSFVSQDICKPATIYDLTVEVGN